MKYKIHEILVITNFDFSVEYDPLRQLNDNHFDV